MKIVSQRPQGAQVRGHEALTAIQSDAVKKAVADLETLFKTHGLQALQEETAAIHMQIDRVKADRAAIERRISVLQKNKQLYDILNQPFPRDEDKEAAAYDQLDSLTSYTEKLITMADSYRHTAAGFYSTHMANVKEAKQRSAKDTAESIKNRSNMPKDQDKKRETGLRYSTCEKPFGGQPSTSGRNVDNLHSAYAADAETIEHAARKQDSVKSDTEPNSN
jgi:hypothetical protein